MEYSLAAVPAPFRAIYAEGMKKTIPPTRSVDFHPASAAKQKLGTERHEVLTPIAAHLLHHGREPGTPSPDGETVVTVMPATGGALATDDEHAAY